jgi:hypothetical protein
MTATSTKAEAVGRRRLNRAARRQHERHRQEERQRHEREVAVRMTARFFPGEPVRLILLDYRYWQLRRCGWDLIKPEYSQTAAGRPCDPYDSHVLYFWSRLHHKVRDKIVRMSPHRLYRV